MRNLTEQNFLQVEVDLDMGGSISVFDVIPMEPNVPAAPRPYGPRSRFANWGQGLIEPSRLLSSLHLPDTIAPRPRIRNGGSARVTFPPIDLRPLATVELDELHLLAFARDAGTAVSVRWAATSTSAEGQKADTFSIDVSNDVLTAASVLGASGTDPAILVEQIAKAAREAEEGQ